MDSDPDLTDGADAELYIQGKQAAADLGETSSVQGDRWKWVRRLAYLLTVLAVASLFFGIIGFLATLNTQDAVQTANFSEEQRAARSNRTDCIREYETDYRLADAKFNAAIVNYLAFNQGSVMEAAELLEDLNRVGATLEAIQNNELCSKEEFGVRD